VLAGRPPASTKCHFYWLKVVGGCLARQQKPVLAVRTNRFSPSDATSVIREEHAYTSAHQRHIRLSYQPPASSTFLLEQTSHQYFLSEQTSTSD
jgi:hypothetical protein